MRLANLSTLFLVLLFGFSPLHTAGAAGLTVSSELAMTEVAATAGVGLHAEIHPSGFGLAASMRIGSSYDGGLTGAFSGELRYTLDVFTYVPWVAVGFGVRTEETPIVFPEASLGCAMMLGFDDSIGVRYKTPLIFQDFSSSFPFEIGVFWSRNL